MKEKVIYLKHPPPPVSYTMFARAHELTRRIGRVDETENFHCDIRVAVRARVRSLRFEGNFALRSE